MSQTWLASHTGADRLVGVLADALATLAPADGELPHGGPEVRAAEHDVEHEPQQDEDHRELAAATRVSPPATVSGARARRRRIHTTPAPDREVDDPQRRVADRDAAGGGDRLRGRHHAIDDPRLAPDLGRHPPADQGHDRQRPGGGERRVEPARLGQRVVAARARRGRSTPSSASSVPMPTIAWKQMRTMFTGGRSSGATASRPSTRALGSWKASTESIFGMPMPNFDLAVVIPAQHVDRRAALGPAQPLQRGELGRLRPRRRRAPPSRRPAAAPARPAPRSSAAPRAPCARSGPSARAGARPRRPRPRRSP